MKQAFICAFLLVGGVAYAQDQLPSLPQAEVTTPAPLIPGGTTRLGLGLWNSLWGTLVVEAAMFAGGLAIYLRSTTARSRAGTIGLWSLVAFLLITYLGALFGPPPPSAAAVAWSAEAVWLLAAWAAWSDGARSVREEEKEERPESRRLYQ